ncbi:mitochondrial thiamine pyrophosphate carrier-like [Armigeres subalbatus]|uniref:mitochondrial thiamine pyrophosphate carrier-like n=1 Tax=Armigeres subalbatus TaxID=124917 RepID=UPI002ED0777D
MDRPKEDQIRYAGLAGGITGSVTRTLCQPFDVIKIRLQLQVEPIKSQSPKSKYRTIFQTIGTVYREESMLAFWKGHNAAQVLSMTQGVAQFTFYERFNGVLRGMSAFEGRDRARIFLCGACSGSFATFTVMPLDVIKTRLVSQDPNGGYRNAFHAVSSICQNEGLPGLYRGLGPAIMQTAPLTGGQYMFYNLFGDVFKRIESAPQDTLLGPTELMVCGALSGLCTKLILYPLDLVKRRLQIQGFSEGRRTYGKHFVCKHLLQCMYRVVRKEGFLGLYKGLSSSLLKAAVTSAIFFTLYDKLLYSLNKHL